MFCKWKRNPQQRRRARKRISTPSLLVQQHNMDSMVQSNPEWFGAKERLQFSPDMTPSSPTNSWCLSTSTTDLGIENMFNDNHKTSAAI